MPRDGAPRRWAPSGRNHSFPLSMMAALRLIFCPRGKPRPAAVSSTPSAPRSRSNSPTRSPGLRSAARPSSMPISRLSSGRCQPPAGQEVVLAGPFAPALVHAETDDRQHKPKKNPEIEPVQSHCARLHLCEPPVYHTGSLRSKRLPNRGKVGPK